MQAYRSFQVTRKVKESNLVVSLYLSPIDQNPLIKFKPGQHLMFKLHIPGHEIPVFRYYSFSDHYHPEYYRISLKKELPPVNNPMLPEGLASSYLFDVVKEGDILEAKGPSGNFYLLPEEENHPVVLIAGGIGITPLLSMIKSIALTNPRREVYFMYGVNDRGDHSFLNELQILRAGHSNFYFLTFYTKVGFDDVQGLHYDYEGYINIEKVSQLNRHIINPEYYICGPAAMMDYLTAELEKAGVEKNKIYTEAFNNNLNGPTLNEEEQKLLLKEKSVKNSTEFLIEFQQSNRKLQWNKQYKSILEFAEANDIEISSGCLFGDCGTCLTGIIQGDVQYIHPTLVKPGVGQCLPCSCIPSGNLVLEA
ncbi:MAG: FAD-binding oxidoreductase [Daejeonella sp.]